MKSDNTGRLSDGRKESHADAGAGAGVGLSRTIRRGHDRRERAQGSRLPRLTPEVLRMLSAGEDHSGDYVTTWTGRPPDDDMRSGGWLVAREALRDAKAVLGLMLERLLELALIAVCVGCSVFLLTVAYVLLS